MFMVYVPTSEKVTIISKLTGDCFSYGVDELIEIAKKAVKE
jgi:hypothetical protein